MASRDRTESIVDVRNTKDEKMRRIHMSADAVKDKPRA